VLKLQKIEKQRKAAEIPHRESYQKLEKVTGRLFQVKLDATSFAYLQALYHLSVLYPDH
jgi:hypothetical protein